MYNYCRITLSCPLSKMLWFPLNHLQVLQRHGRYPMDSTMCPLSPCPTQDLFIRFQAVTAQLCSQLGIPHLPPSLQGPEKVAAGERLGGNGGSAFLLPRHGGSRGRQWDPTDEYSQSRSPPRSPRRQQAKCLRGMHSCSGPK